MAQRELREGARRPANYRLRVGSGLAGACLLWLTLAHVQGMMGQNGLRLFLRLHCLLLALIAGMAPGLTADCIARERREGTLGLLFLTPLTARGVVMGKSLAHILRAFTLWLAMLPVLTIPFLTGGVNWDEALRLVTIEFCAGVICLAAGLMASALARTRQGAFILAYTLAGLALAGLAIFEADLRSPVGAMGHPASLGELLTDGLAMATGNGADSRPVMLHYAAAGRVPGAYLLRRMPWSAVSNQHAWMVMLGTSALAAGLSLYLAIAIGAAVIKKSWQDKAPSARQLNWLKRLGAPLFRRYFDQRRQRSLDRNPVAWLQEYSWKARASKWGLGGAFILMETFVLAQPGSQGYSGPFDLQPTLTLILAAVFTFAGVSGFLAEKRSGALELLLVTPLSVNRIILGRAWGLWKQFLPAAVILLGGEAARASFEGLANPHWALGRGRAFYMSEETFLVIFLCANAFLALPVFATYAALRVKNLMGAAALTWAGLLTAWLAAECVADTALATFINDDWQTPLLCASALASAAAFMALAFFLLRHSLARRIYAF